MPKVTLVGNECLVDRGLLVTIDNECGTQLVGTPTEHQSPSPTKPQIYLEE